MFIGLVSLVVAALLGAVGVGVWAYETGHPVGQTLLQAAIVVATVGLLLAFCLWVLAMVAGAVFALAWGFVIEPLVCIWTREVPPGVRGYASALSGRAAVIYSLMMLVGLPGQLVFWLLAAGAEQGVFASVFAVAAIACNVVFFLGILLRG